MNAPHSRPLSPHIQIWKWTLTMTMSILHRASGMALCAGLLMIVWLLVAAASGAGAYNAFTTFATSILGQLMLIGWTFAIFLHMGSGIRHLIMDTGRLLTVHNSNLAVLFIWVSAAVLTAATWLNIWGDYQ